MVMYVIVSQAILERVANIQLMIVPANHVKMVQHALMKLMVSFVNVVQVSLVFNAKLKSTNV